MPPSLIGIYSGDLGVVKRETLDEPKPYPTSHSKVNVPQLNSGLLLGHLDSNVIWLGVDLRTNTKKTCV